MTPQAYSLFKFTEIPVGLTTGVPDIHIPIYEINYGTGTLPITVNYHSSGVKVSEQAGNVGLGWTIMSGGMISSNIVGSPDLPGIQNGGRGYGMLPFPQDRELTPHYTNYNDPDSSENSDYNICMKLTGNNIITNRDGNSSQSPYDGQPDIFYYSIGGRSGKFFLGMDQNYHTIPYEPIDIQYVQHKFVFTDEMGTKYLFNDAGEDITYFSYFSTGHPSPSPNTSSSTNKTFYLSKIITIKNDTITFLYKPVTYSYNNPKSYTRYKAATTNTNGFDNNYETRTESSTQVDGRLIESIQTNKGDRVQFSYETCPRLDVPGNFALKEIKIFTDTGSYSKKYTFTYGYFNIDNYTSCSSTISDPDDCRLKLLSIQQEGLPPYIFSYYGNNQLPNRMSDVSADHWGYYSPNGGKYPDYPVYGFSGASRMPDQNYTSQGVLSRVKYPTGGISVFDYELNEAKDTLGLSNDTVSYGGGNVAIYYDPDHQHQQKSFTIPSNVIPGSITISYLTPAPPNLATPQFNISLSGNGVNQSFQSIHEGIAVSGFLNLLAGNYTLAVTEVGAFEDGYVTLFWKEKPVTIPGNDTTIIANVKVGGLRIKRIREFNDEDTTKPAVLDKSYEYNQFGSVNSSGKIAARPVYSYYTTKYARDFEASGNYEERQCTYYIQNSQTISPLNGLQGSPILYTNVRVYDGDNAKPNGYTDYEYSFVKDLVSYVTLPPAPPTSYDWQRGLLMSESEYSKMSSQQFKLKRKKTNYYTFLYTPPNYDQNYSESGAHYTPPTFPNEYHGLGLNVQCIKPEAHYYLPDGIMQIIPAVFELSSYKLISSWYYINRTREDIYETNTDSSFTTSISYVYDNPLHAQLTMRSVGQSNGDSLVIKYLYPLDYLTGTAFIDSMQTHHILSAPVEQVSLKKKSGNFSVTDGKINKYRNDKPVLLSEQLQLQSMAPVNSSAFKFSNSASNGLSAPKSVFAPDSRYVPVYLYSRFDAYSNIVEMQKVNNAKEVYLWGYNGRYPVAKIIGSDYNTVNAVVPEEQVRTATGIVNNNTNIRNLLNTLRTDSRTKNALISTYTYAPLTGMMSETDPQGNTLYYEYDDFNRLSLIKDKDGNIVKRYNYQYSQSQENGPIYYSTAASGEYVRNNCSAGYGGTKVTYTVPAGTYSSIISQANADQQALDDIAANGQAYANANGTCSNTPASIVLRNSFTAHSSGLNTKIQFIQNGAVVLSGNFSSQASGTVTLSVAPGEYQIECSTVSLKSAVLEFLMSSGAYWSKPANAPSATSDPITLLPGTSYTLTQRDVDGDTQTNVIKD
ncbi:hypothetical protein A8C56_14175 [Niabella ginsenosidivorans]|uniref:DUF5977 domain-containing protein n=2 Tax=Niabella ginsenosidivorans TaxID=1176587 RepID=A0A1A9I5K3_9BACT|nr:hypothetical protein A8C56_14175 [Niabella ginsenosidivorans]